MKILPANYNIIYNEYVAIANKTPTFFI